MTLALFCTKHFHLGTCFPYIGRPEGGRGRGLSFCLLQPRFLFYLNEQTKQKLLRKESAAHKEEQDECEQGKSCLNEHHEVIITHHITQPRLKGYQRTQATQPTN